MFLQLQCMYIDGHTHPKFTVTFCIARVMTTPKQGAWPVATNAKCKLVQKIAQWRQLKFYLTNEWQMIQSVNAIILIKILPSKVQNLVSVFRNWYVWSNDLLLTSSRQYTIQCSSDSAVWLSGLSWYCKSRVVLCITHQTWLKTSSTLYKAARSRVLPADSLQFSKDTDVTGEVTMYILNIVLKVLQFHKFLTSVGLTR